MGLFDDIAIPAAAPTSSAAPTPQATGLLDDLAHPSTSTPSPLDSKQQILAQVQANPSSDFLQAFGRSASQGARIVYKTFKANELGATPEFLRPERQAQYQQLEQKMPLLGDSSADPSSIAGKAGRLLGSLAEPVTLVAGGVGAKAAKLGLESAGVLAEDAALQEFKDSLLKGYLEVNKSQASQAANNLFKEAVKAGVGEGAGGGLSGGLVSGVNESVDKGQAGGQAFKTIGEYALAGLAGGTVLGGAAGALLGRSHLKVAGEVPEKFTAPNNPTVEALTDELEKLHGEAAKHQEALQPRFPSEAKSDQLQALITKVDQAKADLPNQLQSKLFDADAQLAQHQDGIAQQLAAKQQQLEQVKGVDPTASAALETEISGLKDMHDNVQRARAVGLNDLTAEQRLQGYGSSQLERDHRAKLEAIDSSVKAKEDTLNSRRDKLLQKLSGEGPSAEEASQIQKSLSENLYQQARLKSLADDLRFTGVQANTQLGTRRSGLKYAVQQGIDIAFQQAQKAKSVLAESGIRGLDADKINEIATLEFRNALNLQSISSQEFKPGFLDHWLNQTERWSNVDGRTGANATGVVLKSVSALNGLQNAVDEASLKAMQSIEALQRTGMTNERMTEAMTHMESTGFNPAAKATKQLERTGWEGPMPTQEQLAHLQNLRGMSDELFQQGVKNGTFSPEQYVDGHVRKYSAEASGQNVSQGKSVSSILNPGTAESRQDGKILAGRDVTDFSQIMPRYIREVKYAEHVAPVLQDGVNEITKLRLLGFKNQASNLEEYLTKTFNLNTKIPLDKMYGNLVSADARAITTEAGKSLNIPQSALEELYQHASSTLYKNMAVANPRNVIYHFVQPDVLLPAEVGVSAYSKARVQALTKSGRDEVAHLLPLTLHSDLPALDELAAARARTGLGKLAQSQSQLLDKLQITKPFALEAKNNRVTALIAGRRAFDSALNNGIVGLKQSMQNWLPGEQKFVLDTLQKQGTAAAKDAFALIVDRRTNFAYNLADRPDVLREGLGKYVPFTTFWRNILARYGGDIANGNYTQAAKRLAIAWGAQNVLQGVFKRSFEKLDPIHEAKTLMQGEVPVINPATQLLQAGQKYYKKSQSEDDGAFGDLAKDLAQFTAAGPAAKFYDRYQKSGDVAGGLGLKAVADE